MDLNTQLPAVLGKHNNVSTVVAHVGSNDTSHRESETLKEHFKTFLTTLKATGKNIAISGPLPTYKRGIEKFSRLLCFNSWLKTACDKFKVTFIDNFDFFWGRPAFSKRDGLYLNHRGSQVLAQIIGQCISPSLLTPHTSDFIKPIISTRPNTRNRTIKGPNMNNLVIIPINRNSFSATTQTELKMALFNIRALTNKSCCISDLINDHSLDGFFLTETWPGTDAPATLTEACPPSYTFSYSSREGKKGGGTAAIYRETLKGRDVDLGTFHAFEYNATLLNTQPRFLAVTVYRSPRLSVPSFLTEFSDLLSIIHTTYDTCILIGDFNIHVDNLADTRAKEFLELLECMAFEQHVKIPTHKHGHTLDLIISYGLNINISSVIDLALSDHHCVFFNSSDHSLPNITERLVKKRSITPEVATTLTSHIASYKNDVLPSSCEDLVHAFNHKMKTVLDAVAQLKPGK